MITYIEPYKNLRQRQRRTECEGNSYHFTGRMWFKQWFHVCKRFYVKAKEFVNTSQFQNRLAWSITCQYFQRTGQQPGLQLAEFSVSGNKKIENFNHYWGEPIHLVDSKTKVYVSKNINKLRSGLYKATVFCKNTEKHEIVSGVIVSFIH